MNKEDTNFQSIVDAIDMHCRIEDKYGFTIPYIYKIANNNGNEKTINDILLFFKNHNRKHIITQCNDLDELIIGQHKIKQQAPINMYKNFGNLHYDDEKIGPFSDFNELTDYLINRYLPIVKNGKYSKNINTLVWE